MKAIPQSFRFQVLFCALVLFLAPARHSSADDFTRFLRGEKIQVVMEDGKPKQLPGASGRYLVHDMYGNLYVLQLQRTEKSATAAVTASLLREAAGLPNATVYPITVRRGENGIPRDPKATVQPEVRATLEPMKFDSYVEKNQFKNIAQLFASQLVLELAGRTEGRAAVEAELAKLPRGVREGVVGPLNDYLSRLEQLSPEDLAKFPGDGKMLAKSISTARGRLKGWLKRFGLSETELAALSTPAKVSKPLVLLPPLKAKPPRWVEDGKLDPARIYEVAPNMAPSFDHPENDPVPQTHLSDLNPETLVVVPLNDDEALEIARISKEAGAHVLALSYHDYPHGGRLDGKLLKQILAKLKETPSISRVAIVELPGKAPAAERILQRHVDFFVIDHHDYHQPGLNRYKPDQSSLEHVAKLLGWKLSPTSRAIAANDRGFIPLLLELGLPKELLYTRCPPLPKELEDLKPIPTKLGPLYVVKNFDGKIGDTAALYIRDYPVIPSVLMIDQDSVRFTGNPKHLEGLIAIGNRIGHNLKQYKGGDEARSMFWGMKSVPVRLMPELTGAVAGYVSTVALEPVSISTFDTEAPKPSPVRQVGKYGAPMTLAEVFSFKDSKLRGEAWAQVRWQALSAQDREKLLELAPLMSDWAKLPQKKRDRLWKDAPMLNSFDVSAVIRIAAYSGDPVWLETLTAWESDWRGATRGWQSFARQDALKAIEWLTRLVEKRRSMCLVEVKAVLPQH